MAKIGATQQVVVILGMHRSGTSALAGTLHLLGVEFGADLIGASPSNPKGHFEMTAAVRLNDHLLRRVFGSRWKHPFDLPADWPSRVDLDALAKAYGVALPVAPVAGLKDPRMCRLVPVWRALIESQTSQPPKFDLILRRPEEVTLSLLERDGLPVGDGMRLWREHVVASERSTRDAERLVVTYEGLLERPLATAKQLARFAGVPEPGDPGALLSFLDPHLRHHGAAVPSPKQHISLDPSESGFIADNQRLYAAAHGGDLEEFRRLADSLAESPGTR